MFSPLQSSPFPMLPSRFLMIGLLVYVGLEMVAVVISDSFPQLNSHQQSVVFSIRFIELVIFSWLIYHYNLLQSLGLSRPTRPEIIVFLQIATCCSLIVGVLYWIQPTWFAYIGIPSWIHGFGGLFLMIVLAPVVEELIFRGLLYRMLREQWNIATSVVVSAVFFSLLHQGQMISPQLAGGIIFALAYEWSRSLWVAIGLHMGANSAVYVLSVFSDVH